MDFREISQVLRDPRAYTAVLGATVATASYEIVLPPVSLADCTTTTEVVAGGGTQTTQNCSSGGETGSPEIPASLVPEQSTDTVPLTETSPSPDTTSLPSTSPEPSEPDPKPAPAPKEKRSEPKHKTGKKVGVVAVKLPRHISYDQCGWGHNGCASGCGVAAGATAVTDLTGDLIDPTKALPIIGDAYLSRDIPHNGGTTEKAFSRLANHYNLKETSYDITDPADLNNTARVIGKMGGVAIGLFRDHKAVERSGKHSKIAMNGHYVVLDRYLKQGFGLADSHKGGRDKNNDPRHNERTKTGKIRTSTARQLYKNGLIHIWTLRRTHKTPLNPKYS